MIGYVTWTAVITFTIWFLNGLRKVIFLPQLKLISFEEWKTSEHGLMIKRVDLIRQTYLPPFHTVKETWSTENGYDSHWTRIPDGRTDSAIESNIQKVVYAHLLEQKHLDKVIAPDV